MNKNQFKCDKCGNTHDLHYDTVVYINEGKDRILCEECGDETLVQPTRLTHDKYNYMDEEFNTYKKVV